MASTLKSAGVLLTGLVTLLAFLGLLALCIYVPIAHPADLGPLTFAVQGVAWVMAFGRLAWALLRERPRSPGQLVRVISDASVLLGFSAGLLVEVGAQLGWWQGPTRYAVSGAGLVLLLAIGAYWLFGERRLRVVLERRAAAKDEHSPERVTALPS